MQRNAALCGAFDETGAPAQPGPGHPLELLERSLSPAQLRAIGLILVGRSAASVARALGVNRATIFRWRQQPAFAQVLRFRQEALFNQAGDRLRATLVKAVREVERDLRSRLPDRRLRTAFRLLPYVGSPRLRPADPGAVGQKPPLSAPPGGRGAVGGG